MAHSEDMTGGGLMQSYVSIICISCLQCTCVHTDLSEGFFVGVPTPHEVLSFPVLHLYLAHPIVSGVLRVILLLQFVYIFRCHS